jgi:hypothetical protein
MPSCDQLLTRRTGAAVPDKGQRPEGPPIGLPRRIGVVGGGVKGLSVAIELIRAFDAARLRKTGAQPEIVVLERDTAQYEQYSGQHRASGLMTAGAVCARELLAHVPSRAPDGEIVGSVRVRPQAAGGAVLDQFGPVHVRLATSTGCVPLPPDAVTQNIRRCVDAAVDAGGEPRRAGVALDMWAQAMRQSPGSRDDFRPLLDPGHPMGRLMRCLALVGGGGTACGQSILQAAASTGVLWPTAHLPDARAPAGMQDPTTPLWRCPSVVDDVLRPMAALLGALDVRVRYDAHVVGLDTKAGQARARLADGTVTTFDLLIDARGRGRGSGGLLQLPPWVAAAYTTRFAGDGSVVMHPETPWRFVTCLRAGGTLEVRVSAASKPGVRCASLAQASPSEAATEVMLQLGFSLADARETRWVRVLRETGDDQFVPPSQWFSWPEPRELVAFEIGQPTLPASRVAAQAVRPVVGQLLAVCRAGSATRHGGPRSLGPPIEAAKLLVQEVVHRLGLHDELRVAAAAPGAAPSETLVCVSGLQMEERVAPCVTTGQRWCLFNQLAVRLGIGYNAYVGQAVGASLVVAVLVITAVVVPIVFSMRRKHHATLVPTLSPTLSPTLAPTIDPTGVIDAAA